MEASSSSKQLCHPKSFNFSGILFLICKMQISEAPSTVSQTLYTRGLHSSSSDTWRLFSGLKTEGQERERYIRNWTHQVYHYFNQWSKNIKICAIQLAYWWFSDRILACNICATQIWGKCEFYIKILPIHYNDFLIIDNFLLKTLSQNSKQSIQTGA